MLTYQPKITFADMRASSVVALWLVEFSSLVPVSAFLASLRIIPVKITEL